MGVRKKINAVFKQNIEGLKQEKVAMLDGENIKVLERYEKTPPKTPDEVKELMEKVLCWGCISYCCQTPVKGGKSCDIRRDAVLEILGLTHEHYEEYKQECFDLFLSKYWKKKA
jgi:hypothetical protein